LKSTAPRSKAFSETIIGGPSSNFISATLDSGTMPNAGVFTGIRLIWSMLLRKSWARRTLMVKRWRPSMVCPMAEPPMADSTMVLTSLTLTPNLPSASRFASMVRYFPPVMGSTYKSFTPGTPARDFFTFSESA